MDYPARGSLVVRLVAFALGVLSIVLLSSGCLVTGPPITQSILQDAERRRLQAFPATKTPTMTPIPATPTLEPTGTPREGRTFATVRRVWDGNTILIDGGNSVRYIGVNTPGAGMFNRPLEPFGREAAERNVDLVEGKQVELEADATDIDSGGLMLRYVYVDGVMVNEQLLSEGLARVGPMGRNTRYAAVLNHAESDAKQTPLNIWTLITYTPTITQTPTITETPTITLTPTITETPRPSVTPFFLGTIVRLPTPFQPLLAPPTPPRPATVTPTRAPLFLGP